MLGFAIRFKKRLHNDTQAATREHTDKRKIEQKL